MLLLLCDADCSSTLLKPGLISDLIITLWSGSAIFSSAYLNMLNRHDFNKHFLQFSDYVHIKASTNMSSSLLGLFLCISHEIHLKELCFFSEILSSPPIL